MYKVSGTNTMKWYVYSVGTISTIWNFDCWWFSLMVSVFCKEKLHWWGKGILLIYVYDWHLEYGYRSCLFSTVVIWDFSLRSITSLSLDSSLGFQNETWLSSSLESHKSNLRGAGYHQGMLAAISLIHL